MTTAIIFDMDGTLFQTNLILEPALEATFDVLRANGEWSGATPIEKYREIMGVPLPVVWATLCPKHSMEQHVTSNQLFQEALITQIKRGKGALYEGVEATLAQLSKDHSLYIASNGQTAYLQAIVEQYQLERFINGVYSIDLIASGNKSELVQFVKEQNNIEAGYVVGDRASDINAARHNQLTSIGVRFDFAQESELAQADYVVDDFNNIFPLVLSNKV
ncbi:HAD hydrolase-like protein [Metasolibacillus meyeri]|uniref:HAD hydrolase-like protein n=1 Tax=Metasolibacillus meyeri TaxID=1071052 RepID=A0AAW9NK55_9BACL|nr:HAD hydrolase-like protein [Metasolibacillus meyeri]MEC1177810.1 HAD hydrolase-like protein [Metasolibacillus meyeri]